MTPHDSRSDEALVQAARAAPQGDGRAFEVLLERHQSRVLANCRSLSGSPDAAEDLAQEVFVKAYFALRKFQERSSFKTWLTRIKTNHCLNYLRRQKGKIFVDVEDPDVEFDPALHVSAQAETQWIAATERDRIHAVLDSMPETLRLPLVLRELDDFAYQDIASSLGLGLSAVKMRIKRAREVFRQRFDAAQPAARVTSNDAARAATAARAGGMR